MKDSKGSGATKRVSLAFRFQHFALPPVRDALIIGRRAPIGSHSIARAFQEMSPGMFRLVRVEHPIIEAILVRESDLRKVSEEILIERLLQYAQEIMDETDTLKVEVNVEVLVQEEDIELP